MQMRGIWLCSFLGTLGLLSGHVGAEKYAGSFRLSPKEADRRVHYITKFACGIGQCQYKMRAALKSPYRLLAWGSRRKAEGKSYADSVKALQNAESARMLLRVVLDDEWERSHDTAPCARAEMGRGRTSIEVPLNGTFGALGVNTFRQTYKPHFWYFFGEDCRNGVAKAIAAAVGDGVTTEDIRDFEIMYELEITQVGGSQLSYELVGMFKWSALQLVCYGLVLGWMIYKQMEVMKNQLFKIHIMSQILNAALISSIAGTIFHMVYLLKVGSNGSQYPLLLGLSEACFAVTQIGITSCLILIAMGVTLNVVEKMPLPVFGVIGAAITAVHIIIIITDKYLSDSRYRYYGAQGAVGYILTVFRVALTMIFLLAWHSTRSDPRTPLATDLFLRRLLLPSLAFFLTLPSILFFTSLAKPYWRHAAFFHLTFLLQLSSIAWLAHLFLHKGEYFRVSSMGQSFLPGGVWRPTLSAHHID